MLPWPNAGQIHQRLANDTIVINLDPGFSVAIAGGIHTYDNLDRPVARSFLWTGKSIAAKSKRAQQASAGERYDSDTAQRQERLREQELRRGAIELFEVAGILNANPTAPFRKRGGWQTFSSNRPRKAIIAIGADTSHPGQGRGVHRVPQYGPFLRKAIELARTWNLDVEFVQIDEAYSSQACPRVGCTTDSGDRIKPVPGARSK